MGGYFSSGCWTLSCLSDNPECKVLFANNIFLFATPKNSVRVA